MTTSQTTGLHANPSLGVAPNLRSSVRTSPVTATAWAQPGSQWSAIAGGAFSGLAVGVALATLGAALGLTASAALADPASVSTVDAETTAAGFGIGAGIWLLVMAAAIGLAAGGVLARMSHGDRAYSPRLHGIVTWAFGVCLAVLLAVPGATGLASGLSGLGAGAAASAPSILRSADLASADRKSRTPADANSTEARPEEASLGAGSPALTPEQRAAAIEAAETAAAAASMAAWFALVALAIGLGTTIWAAGRREYRPETAPAVVAAS